MSPLQSSRTWPNRRTTRGPPPPTPRRWRSWDRRALVDDMDRVGLVAPVFQFWDRPSQGLVAEFHLDLLAGETPYPYVIQCEQFKTSKLLLKRLAKLPNVEILFCTRVVGLSQAADTVTVTVEGTCRSVRAQRTLPRGRRRGSQHRTQGVRDRL